MSARARGALLAGVWLLCPAALAETSASPGETPRRRRKHQATIDTRTVTTHISTLRLKRKRAGCPLDVEHLRGQGCRMGQQKKFPI